MVLGCYCVLPHNSRKSFWRQVRKIFPSFLQLKATNGIVSDWDDVFECKKLVLGHKTQNFMILTWYWVGIVFYPLTVESHFGDKVGKTFLSFLQLKATYGIVSDWDNVFECKKLVWDHKTWKFMILIWYWVGIVFYPYQLKVILETS